MSNRLILKKNGNAVQFFLGSQYLGLINHNDGYLSDFRAVVRKGQQKLDGDLYKVLKVAFFEMLNHYLRDYLFLEGQGLQDTKNEIVKNNDSVLKSFTIVLNAVDADA
jgi:hypothetical protein